jgi:hydrophobe/amphiphile efflux-1 (HAE1) family protein
MSTLSEISIRRPVFAWMLMAALITFGMISFHRLGISLLPDVDFPVVSVSFSLNGAAPEVMESQVLDPVEDSIMQIGGIRSITSTAQQSSASIAVEFELNTNIDEALQEIKNHIDQVKNLLPTNLFPAHLRKTNPEDQPIMWLGLTTDDPNTPLIDMMIFAKNYLQDQFGVVPGVGNIVVGGYVDPALRVWLDANKLNNLDITSDDVLAAIKAEQIETPSGQISNEKNEFNIRVMGETRSPEEFGRIRINSRISQGPNYRPTLLKDVADIEEATADIRKISRMSGQKAVGLGIIKQHGSNAVEVGEAVRAKMKEIQPAMPPHFHLSLRTDNTRFIKQSVRQLLFVLILSAFLTSMVCYFFLGSWTSTVNVLMAIPTSIIGTFIAFYFLNFTLNTFTLLGLSLAIGIVVDDAIMMLENIVRHRELGEKKKAAALKGAEEITFAAIAATIAIVAIFLPVVFMKGIIGRYFLQYGITVTVAVLLSLLEALTLTPMRCSRYLTVDHPSHGLAFWVNRGFTRMSTGYGKFLRILLAHRWKTVIITIGFFFGSIIIAKQLPGEMMPAQDQSMFMLRFKLPVGTALPVTNTKIRAVEDFLLKVPEVDGLFSVVGGFGGDAVNQGMAFATLVDRDKRKISQADLIKKLRKEIQHLVPGMETVVQDLSTRGFAASRGFPVEFIIQGPNWDTLTGLTNKIIAKMKASNYVVDVNTDVQGGMPELQITPNREKLARHGVPLSTVTKVINTLMGGLILNGQTEYPKGNHRYEIEVRLKSSQRDQAPNLRQVMVRNNRGFRVPLSDLVDTKLQNSLLLISRLNRMRAITIYGNPAPGHSQQEAMQKTEVLARSMLPAGYVIKMIGSSQSFRESFDSLIIALILGIVVSYMVLGSQFNSFIHPVTVLMALPFSFSGAFIALALTHQSINMYSLIGFILLMGIVKKNSILLVDFTNQCREGGVAVDTALLKACPIRLRPIVMTSTATVVGALPEALSLGPGSEAMIPMAISIIGGVIASTILTLFVVPCVYSLLAQFERPDTLA